MNRREILLGTAGVAVAITATARATDAAPVRSSAPAAPAATQAAPTPPPKPWTAPPGDYAPVSPRAHALYERAIVFDANSGPPGQDTFPLPPAMLALSRDSGVTATKTTLGGINSNFQDTVDEIAWYQRAIETHPDVFMQVRTARDFARAKREKKLGILFSFESADMFEGKIERILIFRNLGVRVMQLSYNKHTPWASGVMENPPTGLTEEGRKAVAKMNEVGVALDISHASPPSYADTLAASTKPVLVTHTGCMAVHRHPRNKTDAQLRAAADKGGVIGIYDLPYLTPSPKQPTLDDYMAHMTHALKICGEDHVGIGSDSGLIAWDTSPQGAEDFRKMEEQRTKAGLAAPEEDRPMYVIGLNHNRRPETICDALLKRGYSERVAEKVIGVNFVRALTEIWV
jgi:membrane dipeptidase